jgi:hypothetical protein
MLPNRDDSGEGTRNVQPRLNDPAISASQSTHPNPTQLAPIPPVPLPRPPHSDPPRQEPSRQNVSMRDNAPRERRYISLGFRVA